MPQVRNPRAEDGPLPGGVGNHPARTGVTRMRRQHVRRRWLGLLLVTPALAVIAILVIYPSVASIVGSFRRYQLTSQDHHFIGLNNYTTTLGNPSFRQTLLVTAEYFVVISIGVTVLGLVAALWIQSLRGWRRATALTIVVLPWAVPGSIAGLLWLFILNPTGSGLLNSILKSLHVISDYHVWLSEPVTSTIVIGLTVVWSATPLGVVILLAGLEGIPSDIYEQSAVDGATGVRRFVQITLPLLRPALAIVLLNGAVLAIGLFDQIFVLVGLDPTKITLTGQIYLYAFRDFNFGYAFALSVVATAITSFVSVLYLKTIYREVEY